MNKRGIKSWLMKKNICQVKSHVEVLSTIPTKIPQLIHDTIRSNNYTIQKKQKEYQQRQNQPLLWDSWDEGIPCESTSSWASPAPNVLVERPNLAVPPPSQPSPPLDPLTKLRWLIPELHRESTALSDSLYGVGVTVDIDNGDITTPV